MRRDGWLVVLAFVVGAVAGGAAVHQLNRGLVDAAMETSRALARTAGHQHLILERIDRTGFELCPQWRLAVAAADPALQVELQP